MSRRTVGLLVAAFIVVAAIGVLVGRSIGDDSKTSASTSSSSGSSASSGSESTASTASSGGTTTTEQATLAPPTTLATAGLDPAAAELAAAINKAQGLTYHAVFKGTRTSTSGTTAAITVEVWHQPPLARRDTIITSAKGAVHTQEVRLTDKIEGCIDQSLGNGPPSWMCVPSAGKGVDPADPVLGVARPVSGTVTARNDMVGTIPVRCFSVTVAGQATPDEACFDGDGIPAAFDGGDGRLERTDLDRGVDPAVITVPEGATSGPAPTTGATPTTTT